MGNYKKHFYPERKDGKLIPDKSDIDKIYRLIDSLYKNSAQKNGNKDLEKEKLDEYVRNIYLNSFEKIEDSIKDSFIFKDIEIDVVKGSIYKIKKYFLENNNLKDIRGGSILVDYLNCDFIKKTIKEDFNAKNITEDNIIYCGGGNILIVVSRGQGSLVCEHMEKKITEVGLTVMNAFSYIECTLNDFAFNYKKNIDELDEKVRERSKLKLYVNNPNPKDEPDLYSFKDLEVKERKLKFISSLNKLKKADKNAICSLCDIRDAKFKSENEEQINMCPSCFKKHITGQQRSIFYEEYEKQMDIEIECEEVQSIDNISDEIGVIYGDGNNMGSVVESIDNIFEMMYFSRRTDYVTKKSVYEAIRDVMGKEAKFEVIALGGDDIFIIVPADKAFSISNKIIKSFDNEFDNDITMSIGLVISKSNTPIASLFSIAQSKLKSAKGLLKTNSNIKEGSIDVLELIGGRNINFKSEASLFPMSNSNLGNLLEEVKEYKNLRKIRTQLYKMKFAREKMSKEEFELFYYYQNSKERNNKLRIDSLIQSIVEKSNDININRCEPYSIDWDELILLYERGDDYTNE